jgi:hypothetical protein
MKKDSNSNFGWFVIVIIAGLWLLSTILANVYAYASRKSIGAECCDEWFSNSTSSGACSGHGGVRNWRYHYWYHDTKHPQLYQAILFLPSNGGGSCEDD